MPRRGHRTALRNQQFDELGRAVSSNCPTVQWQWLAFCPHVGRFFWEGCIGIWRGGVRSGRRIHTSACQITLAAGILRSSMVHWWPKPATCYRDAQLRLTRIKSVTVSGASFSVDFTTASLTSVSRKALRLTLSLLSCLPCKLAPLSAY